MAYSKKTWPKPEVQRFRSPEEALAHYEGKASAEELEKLSQLLEVPPAKQRRAG